MAVFRVEKNKGYTVMSNHHLRNKELSLKAKGLLSQMLSLPEDWDYTLAGLSLINRESIDAIRTAVWELEKAGYITRRQGRDEKGKMTAIEYTIYEQPQPPALDCPVLENPTADKPILENPTPDNPTSENPTQLNKEIQKTNLPKKEKLNTDISSTHGLLHLVLRTAVHHQHSHVQRIQHDSRRFLQGIIDVGLGILPRCDVPLAVCGGFQFIAVIPYPMGTGLLKEILHGAVPLNS